MDKNLRSVISEDVPAEAELTEYELRKAGVVFISKRVTIKEAFQGSSSSAGLFSRVNDSEAKQMGW